MATEENLNEGEARFVEAQVFRVIDGDTVDLIIRCRLANERKAELSTAEGKAAKKALKAVLKRWQKVRLRYVGADLYHRLLIRFIDIQLP